PINATDFAGRSIPISLVDGDRSIGSIDYTGDGTGRVLETFAPRNASGQLVGHTTLEGVSESYAYETNTAYLSMATSGPSMSGPSSLTIGYGYSACTGGPVVGAPCSMTPPSGASIALDYAEDGTPIRLARDQLTVSTPFDRNNLPIQQTVALGD